MAESRSNADRARRSSLPHERFARYPLCMRLLLSLLGAASLSTSAFATEDSCAELVRAKSAQLERSAVMKLQMQVQAYRFTRMLVDPLSKDPKFGPTWREGNPHWDQAFAVLQPDVLAHLSAAGTLELRHIEKNLPGRLQAKACADHLALLRTPHGATADRLNNAAAMDSFLTSVEKQFPTPARLAPFRQKAREEVDADMGLADGPEVKRDAALHRKAREQLRAFDASYVAASKTLGDARGKEEQQASRQFGAELMKRHELRLVAIMRAFLDAKPK